jgi:hypothetical protein
MEREKEGERERGSESLIVFFINFNQDLGSGYKHKYTEGVGEREEERREPHKQHFSTSFQANI